MSTKDQMLDAAYEAYLEDYDHEADDTPPLDKDEWVRIYGDWVTLL